MMLRPAINLKKAAPLLWFPLGAAYGLAMRVAFDHPGLFAGVEIVSISFLMGTPIAIGAIVVYGLRRTNPSIADMIVMPWIAILLALIGSIVTLLEGAICVIMATPVLLVASSIGGVITGLILRWTNKSKTTLNSFLVLPIALMFVESTVPYEPKILEERVSVEVAASPHRIWEEILNARNIHEEELSPSFTHWIGVPRPLEGVNVMTPEGEVRYSKWERGVNFSSIVTEKIENRSITWRYKFTPESFPKGSMDDHVKIGGKYFDVFDTTFNLIPISENLTKLEIVSHYRVSTSIDFYGVPVARFIAQDFMSTIIQLYKYRSEKS